MARNFHCTLVTPEKAVFEGEVTYASIPAHDGLLGVQANHAPMLVQMGHGILRLEQADGGVKRFELEGGFIQMDENKLTLLSERATELTGTKAKSEAA